MQNKGLISSLAIVFALVCFYHLSFTYCTRQVEKKAKAYAESPEVFEEAKKLSKGNPIKERLLLDSIKISRERYFLDSAMSTTAMNIGVKKFTYKECKEREINLGLDLKGGMNVTLEISTADLIRALSGYNKDEKFQKAIELAIKKQKSSQADFVELFAESMKEIAPQERLASFFLTNDLRDKINYNSTDEDVKKVLRKEANDAFDRTFQILRNRIDKFGVVQPNIQKLQTADRILIELPGIKDPVRVRKLLQTTAQLEFWETYEFSEIYPYLQNANNRLAAILNEETKTDTTKTEIAKKDTTNKDTTNNKNKQVEGAKSNLDSLLQKSKKDTLAQSANEFRKKNPLFAVLDFRPALIQDEKGNYYPGQGPVVGYAIGYDTAKINKYLRLTRAEFPQNVKFAWSFKPVNAKEGGNIYQLIALKITTNDKTAPLTGDVVVDAYQDFDQFGNSEVTMIMNSEGARIWKRLTANNINRSIAIVLDNQVYSFPTVKTEIPTGRSSISGNFTIEEATDLANVLKSGKFPAPVRIVEEAIVGPSLGKEAIISSFWSFVIAFILVLLYMIFFYSKSGLIANLALIVNLFFIFGILASLQAVLTLPGIAGIILTLGMAVDANVIIYERIKEEIAQGKGIRLAIADGYKNAYSAIIDGNVTTILTGIVLFIFGSGPVQGFATTLIIGILSSLFCSIFITRLIFENLLSRNKKIFFETKLTKGFLSNTKIDFIGKRKIAYIISGSIILIGIISLFVRGLNLGVDFSGGRSYVVRFDQDVRTVDVMNAIEKVTKVTPEVKTYGPNNQVKITTKYLVDDNTEAGDSLVEAKIYESVKNFYKHPITYEEFVSDDENKVLGRLSSQKVGPTVARDIKRNAVLAIIFALIIMFGYIAIRFKRWQYGVGATVALFHDALITIGMFSILYGLLPFNLEIDQAFIAAVLTIIGYSVNDTVIVFDRIREYKTLFPKRTLTENMNQAINSTLARTVNTAGTTLVVLIAIFLFGGEVIRGFTFALLIGIIVGTYSSIFVASPIAHDLQIRKQNDVQKSK